MIAIDLKLLLFLAMLAVAGIAAAAIWLDRRFSRNPISTYVGPQSADLLKAFEAAPFGLLLLNVAPRQCVYANECARQLFNILPGSTELPASPQQAELYRDLDAPLQGIPPGTYYHRTVTLADEEMLSWWIGEIAAHRLVFLQDQTNLHKAEKSSRLFLGNLAHELRTPLTAILAHIEVLRTENIPAAAQENSLAIIHQSTNRIARLVQDLLELSRLEVATEGEQRSFDLVVLAEEAVAELILLAEKRAIAITLEAHAPLPRVLGNPDQIKRVFLNLLDNAIKYSRSGDRVRVQLSAQLDGIGVTIQDSGPGILPEHLPFVTQRLYRANPGDVPGSGLGLALVEEILRRHHSRLEIQSQSSGAHTGTTVRFGLPKVPVIEKQRDAPEDISPGDQVGTGP